MSYPYQNPGLSPAERTRDLLSRMTIEEKIGQLLKLDGFRSYEWSDGEFRLKKCFTDFFERFQAGTMSVLLRADWWTEINWTNGIPPEKMREAVTTFQRYAVEHGRLHIPLYIMEEAGHGLMALGATVFPTGLGLGAMWDAGLMRKVGQVIGREVASTGVQATHGPVLDIIRDIRWSRVEENYSEDPYQTSIYAENVVKGLVGEGVVPTLKHFCGHGSPEGGRNSAPTHAGPVEMYNCQLRPFAAAVKAGARSVMSCYNTVDGETITGSRHYLTDVLRGQMGFDGFVVSDREAIPLLRKQRFCVEEWQASAMAVTAGCDVDNGCWEYHSSGLLEALKYGGITEADLDVAAGHVLKLKFELGLFENPYPGSEPVSVLGCAEHQKIALETSRKCLTLLKNDGILPLRGVKRLALIGPNIDNSMNQLGDYSAPQKSGSVITPLAGLQAMAEKEGLEVVAEKGCGIRNPDKSGFAKALEIAASADVIVFVPGGSSTKYGTGMTRTLTGAAISEVLPDELSEKESGEGTDRARLGYSGVQMELFRELLKLHKPIVSVPIQGRPLQQEELLEKSSALLMAWYPGAQGGRAIAEVLFGRYNPAGRLSVSLPRAEGQLPVFYNVLEPRRDYVDLTAKSLLPFGYGLSYTTFAYSGLSCHQDAVSVTVSNTGSCAGDEVVQCYLTAFGSPVQRSCLELCGFQRIHLNPGESRTVVFKLTDDVLGCYDRTGTFRLDTRKFKISVGPNSAELLEIDYNREL